MPTLLAQPSLTGFVILARGLGSESRELIAALMKRYRKERRFRQAK